MVRAPGPGLSISQEFTLLPDHYCVRGTEEGMRHGEAAPAAQQNTRLSEEQGWAAGSRVHVGATGHSLVCTGAPSRQPGPQRGVNLHRHHGDSPLVSWLALSSSGGAGRHQHPSVLASSSLPLTRPWSRGTPCVARGRLPFLLSSVQRERQVDASPPSPSVLSPDETLLPRWLPMSHRCLARLWASPLHRHALCCSPGALTGRHSCWEREQTHTSWLVSGGTWRPGGQEAHITPNIKLLREYL